MDIPENIDGLESSRELDAMCAEHVMGCVVIPPSNGLGWRIGKENGFGVPYYSTSIGDAFALVHAIRAHGFSFGLNEFSDKKCFYASFSRSDDEGAYRAAKVHIYVGESPELAICRASLVAIRAQISILRAKIQAGGYPLPEDWSPRGVAP